jgi:hypothetical protein
MALLLLLVVLVTNVLFQISWQFRLYSALVVLWYLYYYFLHSFKSREATARLDSDTSNRLMIVAIIWVPFLLFLWLTAIGGWISMLRYGVRFPGHRDGSFPTRVRWRNPGTDAMAHSGIIAMGL